MNARTATSLIVSVGHLDAITRAMVRCLTLLERGRANAIWRVSDIDSGADAVLHPPEPGVRGSCASLTVYRAQNEAKICELEWPLREIGLRKALVWAADQIGEKANTLADNGTGWWASVFGHRSKTHPVAIKYNPEPAPAGYLERLGFRQQRPPSLTFLIAGSPGSGKTSAITTASDRPVGTTDVVATDVVGRLKQQTTIAIDYGEHLLPDGMRLRLYGTPGQLRFAHMIQQILASADGVLLLADASSPDPVGDVCLYSKLLHDYGLGNRPVVLGLTHSDMAAAPAHFQRRVESALEAKTTLLNVDARNRSSVTRALTLLTARSRLNARRST